MKQVYRYLVSVGFVAVAVLLRWFLDPVLQSQLVLTMLFGAVALAGWYGGIGPGIVAMALGYVATDYLFLNPRHAVGIATLPQAIGLFLYVASCALTIAFGESMRRGRRRAEAATSEAMRQREQLRVSLTSIGDAVIATDRAGRITFMNPVAERLTGWKEADARDRPLSEVFRIVHELSRAPVVNPALEALRHGRSVALANHTILIDAYGNEAAIDDSAAPIRDEKGSVSGAILVFRDVSERRRQEAARQELAAIVQSSHDAIIGHSIDGTITSWNRAAERLYGYTAAEMKGRKKDVLLPPDRADELAAALDMLKRGEAVPPYETRRLCRDGTLVDMLITASPIHDEHGEVIGASTIGRDITFKKQAEAALRESNRRKDEFLAVLAHELRNPLAPLSNSLYIAGLDSVSETVRKDALAMMGRQLRQLVRLVDDLLDVARISQGKMQLQPEIVDVRAILESAVETTRPLIERHGHALILRLPDAPAYVLGDPTRLSQVFSNLLNNAAKYTPPGGRIELEGSLEDQAVCVTVSDNGVGIPAEALAGIFEIFTQVDHSLTHQSGGLGIGLWLVRTLVELHSGSIEAASDGAMCGSRFTVRLPKAAAPAAARRDTQASAVPNAVKRRVLVVDDNTDSAESMALVLRVKGHEVRVANDGLAAVDSALAMQPDVVLLDIGLPGLDGYEVARRIRHRLGNSVRLIATTGWGRPEDQSRARAAGFDHHLTKPVDLHTLEDLIGSSA